MNKIYIAHSWDDPSYNMFPYNNNNEYIHIDIRNAIGNEFVNEMAMLHLIDEPMDFDLIGMGQYRRVLDFERFRTDCIQGSKFDLNMTIYDHFCLYHSKEYYENFIYCLKDENPMDGIAPYKAQEIDDYFRKTRTLIRCNCFTMSGKLFKKYRSDMSYYISKAMDAIDITYRVDWNNRYDRRTAGFMCERMTSFLLDRYSEYVKFQNRDIIQLDIPSPYNRDEASYLKMMNNAYSLKEKTNEEQN